MGRASVFPVWMLALLWSAETGAALDLSLPGDAVLTHEVVSVADTYFFPTGPFADGALPTRELEGSVTQQAWRIEGDDLTTLQLATPLRAQLADAGYTMVLDCVSSECGGFDFRLRTEILPAPNMFVDLLDFRFLSAENPEAPGAEYVTAMISRTGAAGYVQLTVVSANGVPVLETTVRSEPEAEPEPSPSAPLIETLLSNGHVVLPDLEFGSGSATLADRTYSSLAALAAYLKANSKRRIALVGHTDAVGALENNVALSRRRAAAVLERLAERHGVSRAQMESNGMGYLAPIAPNTTAKGREANRRVEAVLLEAE